jgi:hypothetical protein
MRNIFESDPRDGPERRNDCDWASQQLEAHRYSHLRLLVMAGWATWSLRVHRALPTIARLTPRHNLAPKAVRSVATEHNLRDKCDPSKIPAVSSNALVHSRSREDNPMSKTTKDLKKQARRADAVANRISDDTTVREMRALADAFRAQAKVIKQKKKPRNG